MPSNVTVRVLIDLFLWMRAGNITIEGEDPEY